LYKSAIKESTDSGLATIPNGMLKNNEEEVTDADDITKGRTYLFLPW
jgi:hypothetical protein